MISILRKDLRCMRSVFILSLIGEVFFGIVIPYAIKDGGSEIIPYIFSSYIGLMMTVYGVSMITTRESTRNNDINILLKSLPIDKKDIVNSKMMFPILVYSLITLVGYIEYSLIYKFYKISIRFDYLIIFFLLGLIVSYILSILNFYIALIAPISKISKWVRISNFLILIFGSQAFQFIKFDTFGKSIGGINIVLFIILIGVIISSKVCSKMVLYKYRRLEV